MRQTTTDPSAEDKKFLGNVTHIRSLTGLRFVAALMVFVHHIGGRFSVPELGLPLANSAVSFFFVLSGFILTVVYGARFDKSKEPVSRSDIFTFLKKRFARLWPLHIVCMLICLASVRYLALNTGTGTANALLLHSWIPSSDYTFSLNNVSWSISTELFFYLAFPLLVLSGNRSFIGRFKGVALGTLGLLLVLGLGLNLQSFDRSTAQLIIQANPLMRLLEFSIGILVGYRFIGGVVFGAPFNMPKSSKSNRLVHDSVWEFGVLGGLILWWCLVSWFQVLQLVPHLPVLGGVLGLWIWFCSSAPFAGLIVWVFASSRGILSRLMSTRWMVHLGEISFSFYMIHMIVIRVISNEGHPNLTSSPFAIVLALVASLALSELLFRFVELPCKDGFFAVLMGRRREGITKFWRLFLGSLLKPTTIVAAISLTAVVSYLSVNSLTKFQQTRVEVVQRAAADSSKDVRFGDQATLAGCLITQHDDQIEIELSWQAVNHDAKARRCLYLMDQNYQTLAKETVAWRFHHESTRQGQQYERIEIQRALYPTLHRILLARETKENVKGLLSKNGNDSKQEFLELYCADPNVAAVDTLSIPDKKIRSVINATPLKNRYLQFGESAVLCGYECFSKPDGGAEINMVWRLKPTLTQRRVINFLDGNEAIVGNFGDVTMFRYVKRMKTESPGLFLDQISVGPERVNGGSRATVGLWDEVHNVMVKIDRGKAIHQNQRLIVGHLNSINVPVPINGADKSNAALNQSPLSSTKKAGIEPNTSNLNDPPQASNTTSATDDDQPLGAEEPNSEVAFWKRRKATPVPDSIKTDSNHQEN